MMLRQVLDDAGHRTGVPAALAHPQLRRALVTMHEQPSRAWRIDDLAQHAAISRTSLVTTFRRVVGTTKMGYLTSSRLVSASRLLKAGHAAKPASRQVGFSSTSAFGRAYGHPPALPKPERTVTKNFTGVSAAHPLPEIPAAGTRNVLKDTGIRAASAAPRP